MSRTLNLVLGVTFCLQSAAWAGDPAAALQSHNQVREDVNAGITLGSRLRTLRCRC